MSLTPAERLAETALAEIGYLEKASSKYLDSKTANAGSKNYTKYARDLDAITGFYNGKKQGAAWCDVFVDWCFVKTFGADEAKRLLCQPNKSLGAGCGYSLKYYKSKGRFHTKPAVGDQIFFKSGTGIAHTGIVYDADNTHVYTVEGNTSPVSGMVANGGCVSAKKYKLSYSKIAGYGRTSCTKRQVIPMQNLRPTEYGDPSPKVWPQKRRWSSAAASKTAISWHRNTSTSAGLI